MILEKRENERESKEWVCETLILNGEKMIDNSNVDENHTKTKFLAEVKRESCSVHI